MRITTDGKQRRTRSEWEALVSRLRKSGMTPREFAKQEKLSLVSLQRWTQRLTTTTSDFVELSPPSVDPAPTWRAELELPGGLILRVLG